MSGKTNAISIAQPVNFGPFQVGNGCPLFFIAGPCVIESKEHAFRHAEFLKEMFDRLGVPFVFKASYDKANRTSVDSFRGPGIDEGLDILAHIQKKLNVLVLSDVHTEEQARKAGKVLDILQIPAFLCRQTDLLVEAGRTGKVVNVKKGQFLAPEDMEHAVRKVQSTGNNKIVLTERGVSFGYKTLVSDFRSVVQMRELGFPVVYDATHSVQRPGGLGGKSGGDRRFAPYLAKAAVAVGADGIFMEVHENPDQALSDGPNSLPLQSVEKLVRELVSLHQLVGAQS